MNRGTLHQYNTVLISWFEWTENLPRKLESIILSNIEKGSTIYLKGETIADYIIQQYVKQKLRIAKFSKEGRLATATIVAESHSSVRVNLGFEVEIKSKEEMVELKNNVGRRLILSKSLTAIGDEDFDLVSNLKTKYCIYQNKDSGIIKA